MNVILILLLNTILAIVLISVAFWHTHLNTYTEKANP